MKKKKVGEKYRDARLIKEMELRKKYPIEKTKEGLIDQNAYDIRNDKIRTNLALWHKNYKEGG